MQNHLSASKAKATGILLLFAVLSFGCSSTAKVVMRGMPDMNSGGNAATVKIYELKTKDSFQRAEHEDFWQTKKISGQVQSESKRMYPDTTERFELELSDKTKFIGVTVNFSNLARDPDREKWRSLHAVDEIGEYLRITVHSDRVSVETDWAPPGSSQW